MITLDFETYYSKDYSLSKLTTEEYIRDSRFEVIGVSIKRDHEEPVWYSGPMDYIKSVLDGYNLHNEHVCAHNAVFDGAILEWHFGIQPKFYYDTLSMARPVTGLSVGGSLAKLAKHFNIGEKGTEVVNALGKRRQDFTEEELAEYGKYCSNDTLLTFLLYQILKQFSSPTEMFIIDLMIRMFTRPVLELDRTVLVDHLAGVKARKQLLLDRVRQQKDILSSNPKFAELLRSYGVDPPMKQSPAAAKRGEVVMTYAFSRNDLEFKVLLEHPNEEVQALVAARLGVKSTLEETRTESFLGISLRGTLPILLNYYGAHTGRASGGDKMNLQNLPRGGKLRRAICAPEGYTLLAGDSSQIEARVVAWLAGQDDLVQDFANGVDIYSAFATDVYGRPVDRKREETDANGKTFKPDFIPGFVGKTCILGLGFGMGPPKFVNTLKIGQGGVSVDMPLEQGKEVVALYRRKYSQIPKLWKQGDQALEAMANGREATFGVGIQLRCTPDGVHLPNGMLIRYPNLRRTTEGFKYDSRSGPVNIYGGKFTENVVQALARIVVFIQMAKLEKWGAALGIRVVLTVHDEIVLCVPDQLLTEAKRMMQAVMSVGPSWAQGLPIACELEAAVNYADCK